MNLRTDPRDNPLTTLQIVTGSELCNAQYPNWQFECIDDPDSVFGDVMVLTQTRTQSVCPESLLTLSKSASILWDLVFQLGWVSICQIRNQWVHTIMNTISNGSIVWLANILNRCQQSMNNLWSCKYGYWNVIWLMLYITDVLATFVSQNECDTVAIWFWEWTSTEHTRYSALHFG